MSPLIHLPLESYKARYTELLYKWEKSAFKEAGFKVHQIIPKAEETVNLDIQSGEVLDSVNRPLWCMKQMQELLNEMEGTSHTTRIYCSDFFTPGLEVLPYTRRKFEVSSFCWAQSFDQYDFTAAMIPWMRPWELMALEIYRYIFVASEGLKELICAGCPPAENKIHVVGLPFDSQSVGKLWDRKYVHGIDIDCVYSSRWDKEKNPLMFLQLVEECPDISFAICTGFSSIRGTAVTPDVINKIGELKNLTVYSNLTKGEYYAVLNASRVQFNCALQDWVSFTLLEALTYDCLPLYPNFRSFPDVFNYDNTFLYRPFDLESAEKRLRKLLDSKIKPPTHILEYHDDSLKRIANIISS